jgi:hypothetical protein
LQEGCNGRGHNPALENEKCVDVEFSMVSNEEEALSSAEWGRAFEGMR